MAEALSELEVVWRGWRALNYHDRMRFLGRFREVYRQEREDTLAANRRAEPVTAASVFDRVTLAALDFDARP